MAKIPYSELPPHKKVLELRADEYEHLITTLEGALEEFEELEKELDWFTSLTTERLLDCLHILKRDTTNE